MVVYDVFGCSSTPATVPITITKPTANFTFPSVVCASDTNLTLNSSTGVGNLSYAWYVNNQAFGTAQDTGIVSVVSPNLPLSQLSSTFNLSLVAIDSNGCEDTLSQLVTVSLPHAIPTYSFSGAVLNANGEYSCPPLFGTYQDSSQAYGNITAWNWGFGDGNNSIPGLPQPAPGPDNTQFNAALQAYYPVLSYIASRPETSTETRNVLSALMNGI
jgi:hypothetical protein